MLDRVAFMLNLLLSHLSCFTNIYDRPHHGRYWCLSTHMLHGLHSLGLHVNLRLGSFALHFCCGNGILPLDVGLRRCVLPRFGA
jgi:hypothetical protein